MRGIPSVAPNVGGITEIINGKDGLLFEDFTQESILNRINKIFIFYNEFSNQAKMTSRNYTLENIAIKWDDLLKKINMHK